MTDRQSKYFQGRKPTRIKPSMGIPLHATGAHKKIDKLLGQARAEAEESHKRAVNRAEQIHKRAMKAYRRAHYQPPTPRNPHRHNFKRLLRVNPVTGNRVVACNCGEWKIIPPEGKIA